MNSENVWFDKELLANSRFRYGIPESVEELISEDLPNEITDFIALRAFLLPEIRYLEIGVSLGKNLYSLMQKFPYGSICHGIDLEAMNPYFRKRLICRDEEKEIYEFNGSALTYHCFDIQELNKWKALKGQKFNLIYSDACHAPDAILKEFEAIKKYKLLDPSRAVIIWDDCNGKEFKDAVCSICSELQKDYFSCTSECLELNGWVGDREQKHHVMVAEFRNEAKKDG